MGRSDHLVNINEVYVSTEASPKEKLTICLQHIEERFGGLTMGKKERARTQHGVPTDHLANMNDLSIRRR